MRCKLTQNFGNDNLMGGYGSGRSGGHPTVESSLTLNLPRLFNTGWLKPGTWTSGTLRWSIVKHQETASTGFEARLGEEEAIFAFVGPPRTPGVGDSVNARTASC